MPNCITLRPAVSLVKQTDGPTVYLRCSFIFRIQQQRTRKIT